MFRSRKLKRRQQRIAAIERLNPRLVLDGLGLSEPMWFGPLPYLSSDDTPAGFIALECDTCVQGLEDFEDGTLDFGLSIFPGMLIDPDFTAGLSNLTDSVDADDGIIDGTGLTDEGGYSWFDEGNVALVNLPGLMQSAGVVWTDGSPDLTDVIFEAFDQDGESLGQIHAGAIADDSIQGTTEEDRFFGVRFGDGRETGVTAISLTNVGGTGIEIDHIQFANCADCEDAGLVLSGFSYLDSNDDGIKQPSESPLSGVEIQLVGADDSGAPVNLTTTTNDQGLYEFADLLPGTYMIVQTQPAQYRDGKDTLGSLGGDDGVNDKFTVTLTDTSGTMYNFGELELLPEMAILFGPTPYFSVDDTPDGFLPQTCDRCVSGLEDFEDGTLDFGLEISTGMVIDPDFSTGLPNLTDSVDADDGVIDGTGQTGDGGYSWFAEENTVLITLPGLMQSAGVVWTDGDPLLTDVIFEAFDQDGNSLGQINAGDLADDSIQGTTEEDRFFGVRFGDGILTGVTAIRMTNVGGSGIEIDHIQFANCAACEETELALSGFSYVDANNDGIKQEIELPLLGVEVRLMGTDAEGNAVHLRTFTNGQGFYEFRDLRPGTYTINQVQPPQFVDGKDTLGSLGGDDGINDKFTVTVTDTSGVMYNFGELGLRPEFVTKRLYLVSTPYDRWENINVRRSSIWHSFDVAGPSLFTATPEFEGGTVQASMASSELSIAVFNSAMEQQVPAGGDGSGETSWMLSDAGTYYMQVSGDASRFDLSVELVAPEVHRVGSVVVASGTTADEEVRLALGTEVHRLTFAGLTYEYDAGDVNEFVISGGGGHDAIQIVGSELDDIAEIQTNSSTLVADGGYRITTQGFDATDIVAGGGENRASMYDSPLADRMQAYPGRVVLSTAGGRSNRAYGFDRVEVFAVNSGDNVGEMFDSLGNDLFVGRELFSSMNGSGYRNEATGFSRIDAHAGAGKDRARLYGSSGDDLFVGGPQLSYLQGPGSRFSNYVSGFDRVDAYGSAGNDRAKLYDSVDDDTFVGKPKLSYLRSGDFLIVARAFSEVEALAQNGGSDLAKLYDSSGDDLYVALNGSSYLSGSGFTNSVSGFGRTIARASTGRDVARLMDATTLDVLFGMGSEAGLRGPTRDQLATGFDEVLAETVSGESARLEIASIDLALTTNGTWR